MNSSEKILLLEETIVKLNKQLQKAKEKNIYQEKILYKQSKQAAMGEMINMIAHQWKQPLNNVSILVQEVFFNLKINNKVDITLKKEIEEQLVFMAQTINDFKNFFKKNKLKTDVNIIKLLDSILKLLCAELRDYNIQVNVTLGFEEKVIQYKKDQFTLKELFNSDYLITTYGNELKQVLLNIISNSKDALVVNKINEQKRFINITIDRSDKNSIVIIIEDSAGGIQDKQELKNIWKPYFTTKTNGTGIGLYISKMIVEENLQSSIESTNGEFGLQTKLIIKKI